jgi:flagellar biosynthesis protein FlhG
MGAERLVADSSGTVAGHLDPPRGLQGGTPLAETLGLGKLGTFLGLARRESVEGPSARVVCVASGKGGTGKSILSSNLAVLRARRGERVLLVDFDAGLANAHLLLGLAPQYDLSHVLQGQVRAEEALVTGPAGVKLLSGGVGRHILANPTRRELDRLFKALRPLEDQFDLIVIDHGAGVSYATVTHLAAANALLLVTNHEVTALSDGYALYKRAHLANPAIRTGLVLNRAPDEGRAQSAWQRFQSASQRFLGHAPELVGWVPYDMAVLRSVEQRVPVTLLEPESPSALAIDAVSRWAPIDQSRGARAFFDRARAALR